MAVGVSSIFHTDDPAIFVSQRQFLRVTCTSYIHRHAVPGDIQLSVLTP